MALEIYDHICKFSGAKLTAAAQLIYILRDSPMLNPGVNEPKENGSRNPLLENGEPRPFSRPLPHIMIQDEFGQLQAPMVLAW